MAMSSIFVPSPGGQRGGALLQRVRALAPKQMEPPFLVTQLVVMGLFIWLGIAAVRGFRLQPAAMRAGSPGLVDRVPAG
jgi:hypothetical protein